MSATLRNQGSIALANTNKTQDVIAKPCGVSRVAVAHWISGVSKPSAASREILEKKFGVGRGLWDLEPVKLPPAKKKHRTEAGLVSLPRGRYEAAALTWSIILETYEELAGQKSNLTITERVRMQSRMTADLRALEDMAEKYREGDAELMTWPFWMRIEKALIEALQPYPDAAAAVAIAMGELKEPTK